MDVPILQDIVIVLALSLVIILLFQRIKIPSLIGFLLAGVIAGPNGLHLISSEHEVELLSEIGIIFLLFIIGIEFSLKNLAAAKYRILGGGSFQVFSTVLIAALVAIGIGLDFRQAIFLGFLFSLSSTAIVLKILEERNLIAAPHGKFSVAILIFQDIVVVPMMLVTPLLAGVSEDPLIEVSWLVVKVLAFVVLIYFMAKYLVPKMLEWVVQTKNRELFILTVTAFCLGVAYLTSLAGLSLALGAFFAGLIISESDYSHQATANVMPFREVFISFFFISVGSLLNLTFFVDHIFFILILTLGVIVAKFLLVALTVRLFRYPPRVMFLAALSLFQVGEFSLLLSTVGLDFGLLPDTVYQYFLAVAILSMGITPFIMGAAGRITDRILALLRINQLDDEKADAPSAWSEECKDHIVIVGYGINGENISYAAQKVGIPHIIVDLDPKSYRAAQSRHDHVIFGDASDPLILKEVGISEARVLVIAISDPDTTHRIISSVRIFSKTVCIIVRTRYVSEIDVNLRLGADIVIPEEFETSIEIFTRVMKKYMIPNDRIRSFITDIRSSDYLMLTDKDRLTSEVSNLSFEIPNQEIITLRVSEEIAHEFKGKTLQEIGLRERFSVTLLAIKRDQMYITKDLQLAVIQQGDLLYLFGKADDIYKLNDAF